VIHVSHTPPHIEAADSDLLRDTVRHHDEVIVRLMETAADRHNALSRLPGDPLSPSLLLAPSQLESLQERFIFVLEVACELGSRPGAAD
jgi:hypothetical protein